MDDHAGVLHVLARILQGAGHSVEAVTSVGAALAAAQARHLDLLVVDWHLAEPDVTGTELIRRLRCVGITAPFILFSGQLTPAIRTEAMHLGATAVLRKPIPADGLLAAVDHALTGRQPVIERTRVPPPQTGLRRRSLAHQWAGHVVHALDFDGDLKTLEGWAAFRNLSTTRLRELCEMIRIPPAVARDFMRVLSAVACTELEDCAPETVLDIGDRRTLRKLWARAGLTLGARRVTIAQFLDAQKFIASDHEGLRALREQLRAKGKDV